MPQFRKAEVYVAQVLEGLVRGWLAPVQKWHGVMVQQRRAAQLLSFRSKMSLQNFLCLEEDWIMGTL